MHGQKEGRDCSCSYEDALKLGQWRVSSPETSSMHTAEQSTNAARLAKPNSTAEQRTNAASGKNMNKCQGDCDSDSDCKGNLVCFQRSGFTAIPGCSGKGTKDWDYCADSLLLSLTAVGAKPESTAWQHTNAANRSWLQSNHHRSWPRVCGRPLDLPPDYVRIVGAMTKRAQAHWTPKRTKQRGDTWAAKFGAHSKGRRATIGQLAHLQACLYQTLDAWTELARAFKIRWAASGGALFGALCYHSMPL